MLEQGLNATTGGIPGGFVSRGKQHYEITLQLLFGEGRTIDLCTNEHAREIVPGCALLPAICDQIFHVLPQFIGRTHDDFHQVFTGPNVVGLMSVKHHIGQHLEMLPVVTREAHHFTDGCERQLDRKAFHEVTTAFARGVFAQALSKLGRKFNGHAFDVAFELAQGRGRKGARGQQSKLLVARVVHHDEVMRLVGIPPESFGARLQVHFHVLVFDGAGEPETATVHEDV